MPAKLQQESIEEGEAEEGNTEDTVCDEKGSVESLQSVSDEEEMLVQEEGGCEDDPREVKVVKTRDRDQEEEENERQHMENP